MSSQRLPREDEAGTRGIPGYALRCPWLLVSGDAAEAFEAATHLICVGDETVDVKA
jgi:hypothetical protein